MQQNNRLKQWVESMNSLLDPSLQLSRLHLRDPVEDKNTRVNATVLVLVYISVDAHLVVVPFTSSPGFPASPGGPEGPGKP